jgi:hypothetical protein
MEEVDLFTASGMTVGAFASPPLKKDAYFWEMYIGQGIWERT